MLSYHPSGDGNVDAPALPTPPHGGSMGRTLKASQKPIIDSTIGKSDQLCPEQLSQFQQRRLLASRQRLLPPKQAQRDVTRRRYRQRFQQPQRNLVFSAGARDDG